ncbi:hypothetical protein E2320_011823 [Naja naja]|nr:hypothetical protein E2320_011823 [Naja naja]
MPSALIATYLDGAAFTRTPSLTCHLAEHNYIRCDDRPIVFTHLLDGPRPAVALLLCGVQTWPCPSSGEAGHVGESGGSITQGGEKAGGVGLVKSSLAFELSPFEYQGRLTQPATGWQSRGTLSRASCCG